MFIRTAILVTLSFGVGVTTASAQNANDIFRLFGGMMQTAIIQATVDQWRKLPEGTVVCVDQDLLQRGSSLRALINQGITPSDPRVSGLISACRNQVAQQPTQPTQSAKLPGVYVVDGLALGGPVKIDSEAYRSYSCAPSEQFSGFTWCQKKVEERVARGQFTSFYSILHSQAGVALYVNRYLEPAWFSANEATDDINARSKRYGAPSRIIPMPRQSSVPNGMIVTWGNVVLEPLDPNSLKQLAVGRDVHVGFMIDHIGNFQRSAQQGLPIYRLIGGAGYVWAASWNQVGVGTLRFLAIDTSAIAALVSVPSANIEPTHAPPSRAELLLPTLSGRVVDQANILDPSLRATLTQKLADFEAKSTNQLVVVTLASLQGAAIEDFSYQLSDHWKVGQTGSPNGILLVVAPNERKVRIEIGTGLQAALTTAKAKRIIDDIIIPRFRAAEIPDGIERGVDEPVKVFTDSLQPPPLSAPAISPADEAASIVATVKSTLIKISDRSPSLRGPDNRKRVEEIAARLATANPDTSLAELRTLKGDADDAVRIFEEEDDFARVSEIASKRIKEIDAELDKITSDAPLIQNLQIAIKTLRAEQNGSSLGLLQSALRKLNRLFDDNRSALKDLEFLSP